jgi:hypothetical protein
MISIKKRMHPLRRLNLLTLLKRNSVKNSNAAAQELQKLTNKNLVGPSYDGGYFGAENRNPGIQFIGTAQDFSNEIQTSETYKITLSNQGTAAEDQLIAINLGAFASAAEVATHCGVSLAAVVADGTIIATTDKVVTCSGYPTSLIEFKSYVKNNATRFTKIQMNVTTPEQLQEPLGILVSNPFRGRVPSQIAPSNYIDPKNNNNKLVEFFMNDFQLDDQSVVYFKLLAGEKVTMTFFPGATSNAAAELKMAASQARLTGKFNHEDRNNK